MNPNVIAILAALAPAVPGLVIDIIQLFSKSAVTDADWAALRAKYAGKTYDQYIAGK